MPERFPDISVRQMTPDDIAACAAIVGDTPLWSERYGISAGRAGTLFETALERKDGLIVAVSGNEVVGFAWYLVRGAFGRSGYLRLIGVRSDWRHRNVGAALLGAVEAASGDDLFILVSDFNSEAQKFYARHGYREIGRLPGYVEPGISEIILWRRKT